MLRQALLGVALLAALGLFFWVQQQRLEAEQGAAALAREQASTANADRQRQVAQVATLDAELKRQRAAQQTLGEQLTTTRTLLAQRQRTVENLTRENAALRAWAAQPLPAAARQLRRRPALVGADAYRQWLSGGDPLQPQPDGPGH
nr:Rz-like lysis system protein LysB [Pseudomonas sp. RIT-PI-AD]